MSDKRAEAARNIIKRAAARHFHEGRSYDENPYPKDKQPEYHLAWSEGHNEARAAALQGDDNG